MTLHSATRLCAKHVIFAIVLLSSTGFMRPVVGQSSVIPPRAAPSLGSMSLPGSSKVIPNSIVSWGYWGIQAKACTGDTKSMRCAVIVTNGDTVARSICLSGAHVNFSPTDSIGVFLNVPDPATGLFAAKRAPSLTAPECITVAQHGAQSVVAILSPAPAPAKNALAISVYLEEHLQSGTASSLKARARIPLLVDAK